MWEEVIKLAVGNGLWAVLSCVLLAYLMKDSRRREHKYTETISALMEKLRVVSGIKEDTEKLLERTALPQVPRGRASKAKPVAKNAVAEAGAL